MFLRYFTRLEPTADTQHHLRRHIFGLLFARMVLFTMILGLTAFLESSGTPVIQPPPAIIIAFLSLIYTFSLGSVAILQVKRSHLARFGMIQLMADIIFIAVLIYGTGCSQSLFSPVFILPIIAGGLLLYRIGGLIPAAFATLLYGLVLYLEINTLLPAYYSQTLYQPPENALFATNLFAFYGLLFFLAAILAGSLAGRLRSTEAALSQTTLEYDRLSQLYKQIFDDISTGIITIDDRGYITSFNQAAERITGYRAIDVNGTVFKDTLPEFQFLESGRQVIDFITGDKRKIRIGYSFCSLNIPADPNLSDPGCSNCKLITLQDISKVEQMELQVRKAEKMAAIGEMSASIAHDFRNPLASISGSAQILAMDFNEKEGDLTTEQSLVEIILRESDRMARTINEFLEFARPRKPEKELCNVQKLAQEAKEKLITDQNRFVDCSIAIKINRDQQCFADRKQLVTLICHLLENGCIASHESGTQVVVAAEQTKDDQKIRILVSDKGKGIKPEQMEHIFQPFYTTREDGSGLGLAIVNLIAQLHDTSIQIKSEPGKGCVCSLELAVKQPDLKTTPEPA